MSLVQGEGCVGAAPIGADAEELKAAGSICALGSLDWLSPDTCLPALVSSQEGLLGLHLAFSLTGSNLSFLIKEGTARNEGHECSYQGDIPEDTEVRRKLRTLWGKTSCPDGAPASGTRWIWCRQMPEPPCGYRKRV